MAARRRRIPVEVLAQQAGLELDDALIMLWDEGLDYLVDPHSIIERKDVKRARTALGVATRNEIKSVAYWQGILSATREEIVRLLWEADLELGMDAKNLPKGGVTVLKSEARARGVDPLTGSTPYEQQESRGLLEVRERQRAVAPVEWRTVGREREIRHLTDEEVVAIHYALVDDFASSKDPIRPPGVRDENLLGSAIYRARTGIGEDRKYPSVEMAAAALLHAVIHDHPFHNGNKRTALVSMLVFLDENGFIATCAEDDLFKVVLQTAKHSLVPISGGSLPDREVLALSEWIRQRTRQIERGEKLIQWRRLRKILRAYDCELSYPGGVGNRINIERTLFRKSGLFGRRKKETLATQVFYGDDGRDVGIDTIKKIRSDLRLCEEDGVDSHDFYGKEPDSVTEFINRYRKTLDRLARL